MNKAIAIGVAAGLAVLAGCGHKQASKPEAKNDEIKVEYAPLELKVEKGDIHFTAVQNQDSSIRGHLFYDNNHNVQKWDNAQGGRVYISAIKSADGGPFVIDYVHSGSFEEFCNPMTTQQQKELCPAVAEKWLEKCKELSCDGHVSVWLLNRPSLADWYL